MTDSSELRQTTDRSGGFYELAICLGDSDDHRLRTALTRCWQAAGASTQSSAGRVLAFPASPRETRRAYGSVIGTVDLPDGLTVPCGSVWVREEDGPDWATFYIPMGALSAAYHTVGGFPFAPLVSSRPWREPLNDWLADIGVDVFSAAPFEYALIGFECSGLAIDRLDGPTRREAGLLPNEGGPPTYLRATHWDD